MTPRTDDSTWMESSKVKQLIAAIEKIDPSEKIVVFSFFLTFLKFIEKCLAKRQISSVLFSGVLVMKKREALIKDFQSSGDTSRVFLATVSSCGFGINLTAASHCFFMDPMWNPAVEEQAMNRIHRIGQLRPVTITRFLCRNTVEEDIEKISMSKKALTEMFSVGGKNSGGGGRLARTELLALFAAPRTRDAPNSDDEGDD